MRTCIFIDIYQQSTVFVAPISRKRENSESFSYIFFPEFNKNRK